MIIGISGKANSGKDLVGRMIQYITSTRHPNIQEFEQWNARLDPRFQYSTWKIRKFAGALKEIVCILLGCTREQLEDRTFKETELGEEWWMCKFPDGELLPYLGDYPDFYRQSEVIKLTPRKIMKLLGTECGTQIIHPNIWINTLFMGYKSNGTDQDIYPNWVITDVRFRNCCKAIKDRKGILIRINRPCSECGGVNVHFPNCSKYYKEHISETALDDYTGFDFILDNSLDIPHLFTEVSKILKLCNIKSPQ